MRLREKVERGIFTRLIEVFPPNFSAETAKEPLIGIKQKLRDMVTRVQKIEGLADAIIVADMKDTGRLQLASVYTAAVLKEELGAEVIPVIPTRDMNKKAIRTTFLTCLSLGLESVSLVWGDRYADGEGAKNVYEFRSLAEAVSDARQLADRSDVQATLLSPVNITALSSAKGLRLASTRLSSGADCLLGQPPTADLSTTLGRHTALLKQHGLDKKVLHNIFPFRNEADIQACRARFGWALPKELDALAKEGEPRLLKEARGVVDALQADKQAGVYVSTRGKPELARYILD
jgi:5,10-methylenetetrahydrofolate reductase